TVSGRRGQAGADPLNAACRLNRSPQVSANHVHEFDAWKVWVNMGTKHGRKGQRKRCHPTTTFLLFDDCALPKEQCPIAVDYLPSLAGSRINNRHCADRQCVSREIGNGLLGCHPVDVGHTFDQVPVSPVATLRPVYVEARRAGSEPVRGWWRGRQVSLADEWCGSHKTTQQVVHVGGHV